MRLQSMPVLRILALPSCNSTIRAGWRNRSRLLGVCLSALLLIAVLASPLAAQAQANDVSPATPAQPAPPAHRRPSLDDRVKGLATALSLNEAQQAAVKKILEQRQQET